MFVSGGYASEPHLDLCKKVTPPLREQPLHFSLETEEERLSLSLSERVIRLSFLFRFCPIVRLLPFFHSSELF